MANTKSTGGLHTLSARPHQPTVSQNHEGAYSPFQWRQAALDSLESLEHHRISVVGPDSPHRAPKEKKIPSHDTISPKTATPATPQQGLGASRHARIGAHDPIVAPTATRQADSTLPKLSSHTLDMTRLGNNMPRAPHARQGKQKRYTKSGLPVARLDDDWSEPSLDSTVSNIQVSDSGIGEAVGSSSTRLPDVRNDIAPKHILRVSNNGSWIKHSWSDEPENDEVFVTREFLEPFVSAWMDAIPGGIRVSWTNNNTPQHWKSDINTETGEFLDAIQYDDTMRYPILDASPKLMERWLTSTSNVVVQMECARVGSRRRNPRSTLINPNRNDEKVLEIIPPPYRSHGMDLIQKSPAQLDIEAQAPLEPCHLRPATDVDLIGVMTIYNLEITHGTQALDVEPLKIQDFQQILTMCRSHDLPFLVAVQDPPRNDMPPPYIRTHEFEMDSKNPDQVLAFAFYSVYQPGLAGGLDGTGRFSVKLNVFVHPGFRRKRIGMAIVDKMMSLASKRYPANPTYYYHNPGDVALYKSHTCSPRSYCRIFVEILLRGRDDPAKMWYDELLKERLCFSEVTAERGLDHSHRSRWLKDGMYTKGDWFTKFIYQHDCCDAKDGRFDN